LSDYRPIVYWMTINQASTDVLVHPPIPAPIPTVNMTQNLLLETKLLKNYSTIQKYTAEALYLNTSHLTSYNRVLEILKYVYLKVSGNCTTIIQK